MNYYGILNIEEFKKLNPKGQDDFLLEKGYYQKITTISLSNQITSSKLKPSAALVIQFYEFSLKLIKPEIDGAVAMFFAKFEDEVYGLEPHEAKRAALIHFNKSYEQHNNKGIGFTYNYESQNGIDSVRTRGRLFVLFALRNAIKSNLAESDFLKEYLLGMDNFFKSPAFLGSNKLQDFKIFEIELKKLIQLNDQYGFEKDDYFSKYRKYSELFEEYKTVFKSVEVIEAVYELIKSNKTNLSSYNDSLYQVLEECQLVRSSKENYLKFLKNEFVSTKSDIKMYKPKHNLIHDKRVDEIRTQLSKLTL